MFGRKIGPTGRKRDEFLVFARGHKPRGEPQPYLNKPYKGNMGREAWGQEGVKEAKRSVHKAHPHKWVKFSVHNETRLHRKNKVKKGGTEFHLSHETFKSYNNWYYYVYASHNGQKQKIRGGNTAYKTKRDAEEAAHKAMDDIKR